MMDGNGYALTQCLKYGINDRDHNNVHGHFKTELVEPCTKADWAVCPRNKGGC